MNFTPIDAAEVVAGDYFSILVTQNASARSAGSNTRGQLGIGTYDTSHSTSAIAGLSDIVSVGAGAVHSLALDANGNVWSWGDNYYGQLGMQGTTGENKPVQVLSLARIEAIAAGGYHTLALRADGTVWAWGAGGYGQLGNGNKQNSYEPVQVDGLESITAIAAGFRHSLALGRDGRIWAWGDGAEGQLGNSSSSVQVRPVLVHNLTEVRSIAAGAFHSLALTQDRRAFGWGSNREGQLGISSYSTSWIPARITTLVHPKSIGCGAYHSLAIDIDGRVWSWGANWYGQLGDGTLNKRPAPGLVQLSDWNNAVELDGGRYHTIVLTASGDTYAFGANHSGQLGLGSTASYFTRPQKVPAQFGLVHRRIDFSHENMARHGIFRRGTGNDPLFHSTVVPLNFQLGIEADGFPQKAQEWFGGNLPNETFYHYDASGDRFRADFPIAGFGLEAGGSPLFTSRNYAFMACFGSPPETSDGAKNPIFRITVLDKATGRAIAHLPVSIPADGSLQWTEFLRHGIEHESFEFGLRTRIELVSEPAAQPAWYRIEHSATKTQYAFTISGLGYLPKVDSDYDGRIDLLEHLDGTDPLDPASAQPVRLASWSFDGAQSEGEWLMSDQGESPRNAQYLSQDTGKRGSAVRIDELFNYATLVYDERSSTGLPNINCREGTIRFWFKPNWDASSGGPLGFGRLLEIGAWSRDAQPGVWQLFFGDGVTYGNKPPLFFGGQHRGASMQYLTWAGPLHSEWNQLALTYSPARSDLYLNGTHLVSGGGITLYPASEFRRATGIKIGSDNGLHQARGLFDELETFNYVIPAEEIAAQFASVDNASQSDPPWARTTFSAASCDEIVVRGVGAGAHLQPLIEVVQDGLPYQFVPSSGVGVLWMDSAGTIMGERSFDSSALSELASLIQEAPLGTLFCFASSSLPSTVPERLHEGLARIGFVHSYRWDSSGAWVGIAQKGLYAAWVERWQLSTASPSQVEARFVPAAYHEAAYGPRPALALDSAGHPTWAPLYWISFDEEPSWKSHFLGQPHFQGKALPPEYTTKSVQELLQQKQSLPDLSSLSTDPYLDLDQSPELRRHPALDQFVSDMGKDPIALINYVLNEIQLVDPLDYHPDAIDRFTIHPGGVNRSALGTFLEGQGSPVEQCALLIYLLRQSGVPAMYLFPERDSLKLLNQQMSQLLGAQLKVSGDVPELISVHYPWVAAFIGGRWVHLFPWLKDLEITEGFDLRDFLPSGYDTGYEWVSKYLRADPNIMLLEGESDQVADLFPRFIETSLNELHRGLSIDDLGVQIRHRRQYYARVEDLPRPIHVAGPLQIVGSLKERPLLFNTIRFRVYPSSEPLRAIETGECLMADFLNRKLLMRSVPRDGNWDLVLTLDGIGGDGEVGEFPVPDAFANSSATISKRYRGLIPLESTDEKIVFEVRQKRLRYLDPAIGEYHNQWHYRFDQRGIQRHGVEFLDQALFRKGDSAAFCLHVGRVTTQMLAPYAQELEAQKRQFQSDPDAVLDEEVAVGNLLHLLGMGYWQEYAQFDQLNQRLHKVRKLSTTGHGFALFRPKRAVDGTVELSSDGSIRQVEPVMNITSMGGASIFNGLVRPDSNEAWRSGHDDYDAINLAHASATEHHMLNLFFGQAAVSTVKLLQMNAPEILHLTSLNYSEFEDQIQTQDPALWETIKAYFSSPERDYTEAYVTPSRTEHGLFSGSAAFISTRGGGAAHLSGQIHGANGTHFYGLAPGQSTTVQTSKGIFLLERPQDPNAPVEITRIETFQEMYDRLFRNIVIPTPPAKQLFESALIGFHLNPTGDSGADYAAALKEGEEKGWFMRAVGWVGSALHKVYDPVNAVTGEFYIDSTDIHVPGPMPISIRRTYLSHQLAPSALGFGWKLNYIPYITFTSDRSVAYITEADGAVIGYERQTDRLWTPAPHLNVDLNNNREVGVGATANLFQNQLEEISVDGTAAYRLRGADGSIRLFKEDSFPIGPLTRQRPYLQTWHDKKGNWLRFSYGRNPSEPDYGHLRRIESSNGGFVGLSYNFAHQLIEVYTADGRRVAYGYDVFGDLRTVTQVDGTKITYDYKHAWSTEADVPHRYSTHLIVAERRPDGRVLENHFDEAHRVIAQMATVGFDLNTYTNAQFVYSVAASEFQPGAAQTGYTILKDAYGNSTRYEYAGSQITRITDPIGRTIVQDWFPDDAAPPGHPRSLASKTDARGLRTTYEYDAAGNVLTITDHGDLTGNGVLEAAIRRYTYNHLNLLTAAVDPSGSTNRFFYDGYLLTRHEVHPKNNNGLGIVTNSFEYSDVTDSVTQGGTIIHRASFGLLKRVTKAEGSEDEAILEWEHDARGFATRQVQRTGTGDPDVVVMLAHNARGELVEEIKNDGERRWFAYDPVGRPTETLVFAPNQGAPLSWNFSYYNENGDLTWSDGPKHSPEDYVWRDYDGAGRLTEEIHWQVRARPDGRGIEAAPGEALHSATVFEYDQVGNLRRRIDPAGMITEMAYDAVGRMIGSRQFTPGKLGRRTELFEYEPGGLVKTHTNALGGITRRWYTSTGRLRTQTNPDGTTQKRTYYLDGRLHREHLPNGEYWESMYDDPKRSVTRRFSTDPAIQEVLHFDRRGNLIARTDADGNEYHTEFDGLDRPTRKIGPLADGTRQTSTFVYDSSGRVFKQVNGAYEEIRTTQDPLGRVSRVEVFAANPSLRFNPNANDTQTPIRITTYGYSADHHQIASTSGSGPHALSALRYSDIRGDLVLTRFEGTTEFALNEYDSLGRVVRIQDEAGRITAFEYDGMGRVSKKIFSDGSTHQYKYDSEGNLVQFSLPGGLTWYGVYNRAGQLTREQVQLGRTLAHWFSYEYFQDGPWVGLVSAKTDSLGVRHDFAYDSLRRLKKVSASSSSISADLLLATEYEYNNLGYIIGISQTDAGGTARTVIQNRYDAYGQRTDQEIFLAEPANAPLQLFGSVQQQWSTTGRRQHLHVTKPQPWHSTFRHRADGLVSSIQHGNATFTYAASDAGLLIRRQNPWRTVSITKRDSRARIEHAQTTAVGGLSFNEAQTWNRDSTLRTYGLSSGTSLDRLMTLQYDFLGRLDAETITGTGTDLLLDYSYARSGTLAAAKGSGTLNNGWQAAASGGLDSVGRLAQADISVSHWNIPALGIAKGAEQVSVFIDGQPAPKLLYNRANPRGEWLAEIQFPSGDHQLTATAMHPWNHPDRFESAAVHSFHAATSLTATLQYDAVGRVIRKNLGNARTQEMVWDSNGRLVKVIESTADGVLSVWEALYDPLGRRLRTVHTPIINGVPDPGLATTVQSYYDPEVEFLEIGTAVNGKLSWNLYGLDLTGRYGGAQGLGGLEAVANSETGTYTAVLTDFFGNGIASIEPEKGNIDLREPSASNFGPLPGHSPPSLSENMSPARAANWRGKRIEPIGLYWLGARYYDPHLQRFLSPDPLGLLASTDLYAFANNDPVNYFDPDGRLAAKAYNFVDGHVIDPVLSLPRHALYWGAFRWIGADYMEPEVLTKDGGAGSSDHMLIFINGILTSEKDAAESFKGVRNRANEGAAVLVYNPSAMNDFEGIFLLDQLLGNRFVGGARDVIQTFGQGFLGLPDQTGALAAGEIRNFVAQNPSAHVSLYVHSQGGAIGNSMQQYLSQSEQSHVSLTTFGAAIFAGSRGWQSQTHEVNFKDFVTLTGAGAGPFALVHAAAHLLDPQFTVNYHWKSSRGGTFPHHNFLQSYLEYIKTR